MNGKKTMVFAIMIVAVLGISALSGCTTTETNKKPKANAGPDVSGYVNFDVTLMGSGSDPDGKIKKYEWDLDGDGKFDTVNTTSGVYVHKYKTAGVYNAVLKVTDNKGATATDTTVVTITVKPNSAPVVNSAVPAELALTLNQSETQGLSVVCSDVDGDLLSYQWYVDSNLQTGQTAPNFEIPTDLSVGTHTISVEIKDGKTSIWYNWTVTINPSATNHPPVIVSKNPTTDLTLLEGTTQVYTITATDPDADALTYTWFVDGMQVAQGSNTYTTSTSLSIGQHEILVNVSDGSYAVSWKWNLTIRGNSAPVVNSKNPATDTYTIYEGETVTLSVSATDPDGDTITYSWTKNNIPQYGYLSPYYTFLTSSGTAKTYNFSVAITDAYGLTTYVNWTIYVLKANMPPVVQILSHENNDNVLEGEVITISGIATDDENNVVSVEISIDGSPWSAVTGTASWSYNWDTSTVALGTHEIRVRAYDGANYSAVVSINLVVISGGGNLPPTVSITSPSNLEVVSGAITISGTASDDVSVEKVQVKVDSGAWMDATGTTSWTYALNTLMLSDGLHIIQARAYDGSLYSSSNANVTINVSNGGTSGEYAIVTINMLLTNPEEYLNSLVMLQNAVVIDNSTGMYVVDDSTIRSLRVYKHSDSVAPSLIRLGDVLTIKGTFVLYQSQMCYEIEVFNTTTAPGDGLFYLNSIDVNTKYRPVTLSTVMNNMGIYNNTLVKVSPVIIVSLTGYPGTPTTGVTITIGDGVNTFLLYFDSGSTRPSLEVGWTVEIKAIVTVYHSTTEELKIRKWYTPDTVYPLGNNPPSITITAPTNNAQVSGSITITGTASDSDGTITLVEVQIDNGAWNAASGTTSWTYSLDTTTLSDGTHTVRARATDNGSISSTTQISILVSNAAYQTVTIQQLLSTPTAYNGSLVRLADVTVRDNGSMKPTTTNWKFTINDTSIVTGLVVYAKSGSNRPSNILALGDHVTVQGKFLWWATNQYWEIEIESSTVRPGDSITFLNSGPIPSYTLSNGPTLAANSDLLNRTLVRLIGATITSMSTYTTTQSSTCDLYVNHNGEEFRLYFLAYSNRPTLSAGMSVDIQGLFYRYYSSTSSGTPNIEIRPYFTQDYIMQSTGGNELPTVTITSPTNGATISGMVTITGTASDSDGYITLIEVKIGSASWITATGTTSWSVTVDTTAYSNGPTTITARATDNGSAQGTTSISVTISNTITYTTATIAQLYADTNANSNHFFTVNNAFVIDNGSTSSPTSAWTLVVIDGSTQRSLVVYVSKYAVRPSIIQLGDTLTISGKFMWYETATKSYWEIEVNSTTNCSGDGVTLISSGGTLVYNPTTPGAILFNIEMYNRTLVKFDDATIVDLGTYTTDSALSCGLNVSLGGQTMYIYFNTYSMRPVGLTVGSVVDISGYFYVYYSGGVGLPEVAIRKWWTPDTVLISGSNVPPAVAITTPADGSTVSGEITITGTASDSDGSITSVEVQFGNSGWLAVNGTTSWTITINTTGFANGPTTISARATDNGGAQTTSSISVTVSNVGVSYTMVNIGNLLSNPSNYANTFVHLQNVLVINNGSIKNTSTTWSLVVNDSTYQAGLNVYVKSGANRPSSILYLGDVINLKGKSSIIFLALAAGSIGKLR